MKHHRQKSTARPLLACLAAFAATGAAAPLEAQPAACPPEGDAKQPLALELNPFKNREDAPPAGKLNPDATLAAVIAPGADLQRWSRNDGAVFEGVVVGVKVGGIETVNCHARDPAHRDTHIELALDPAAPETQRVIVEVTPRWREKMAVIADWSTDALRARLLGHRVRVIGWMFDDLEHVPEAENTNPGGARNWRASVWEIHPVTGMTVLEAGAPALAAPAAVPPAAPAAATVPAHKHHRRAPRRTCSNSRRTHGGHACSAARPRRR